MDVTQPPALPTLSVVFLTFNRADLLTIAVNSLRPALAALESGGLSCEIIIADDGSDAPNRALLDRLDADRIVSSQSNTGLSSNHNRGLRACRHEAVLSLQDDWQFTGEPACLESALRVLAQDPEVGAINFIPPTVPLAHEVRHLIGGRAYHVFSNDGLDRRRGGSARPYSDRPHLKRQEFARDIGDYREDLPMTAAELDFQRRVACQTRWKIAYLPGNTPFLHLGASRSFNPGHARARRREQVYRLPILGRIYKNIRALARWCRDSIMGE